MISNVDSDGDSYVGKVKDAREDWGTASPGSGRLNALNSRLKCLVEGDVHHPAEGTGPRGETASSRLGWGLAAGRAAAPRHEKPFRTTQEL